MSDRNPKNWQEAMDTCAFDVTELFSDRIGVRLPAIAMTSMAWNSIVYRGGDTTLFAYNMGVNRFIDWMAKGPARELVKGSQASTQMKSVNYSNMEYEAKTYLMAFVDGKVLILESGEKAAADKWIAQ